MHNGAAAVLAAASRAILTIDVPHDLPVMVLITGVYVGRLTIAPSLNQANFADDTFDPSESLDLCHSSALSSSKRAQNHDVPYVTSKVGAAEIAKQSDILW